MGQRPSAKLFYGFDLYDSDGDNSPEMEKLLELHFEANPDDDASDVIDMWEKLIEKSFPALEIIRHGYIDSCVYALIAKDSKVDTDWDGGAIPVPIATFSFAPVLDWNEVFETFCKVVGLPAPEPDWLLAAYLG